MAFWDSLLKGLRIGRPRNAPQRDTQAWPNFAPIGQPRPVRRAVFKPTPRNIRYFSRTPYARRAINAIKNPVKMLDWEIVPLPGLDTNPEIERQMEVATFALNHPNQDDHWSPFIEQVIEDVLCGAGAIETQPSGDKRRPWFFWPVDGLSIAIYPGWAGGRDEARYAQNTGTG